MEANNKLISNAPSVSVIEPSYIETRLDASYYAPVAIKTYEKAINSGLPWKSVKKSCSKINSGPFGSSLLASQYVETGVPFFRPLNIKDIIADTTQLVFISDGDWVRLRSSQFVEGDILITKIGNGIGDVRVLPKGVKKANISGNLMGIKLKPQYRPYFAVTYFKSSVGQILISRALTNTAKPKLGSYDLVNIPIVLPDSKIQQYIGRKVELAEKCRAEATGYLAQAKIALANAFGVDVFLSVIPKLSSNKPLKITSVKPSCSIVYPDFIKGMIGAHAYAAVHAQVELNLKHAGVKQVALGGIVKEMVNGYDCRDFSETGTAYAKVAEEKAGRLVPNPKQFVSIPLSDVSQKQRVHKNDLLVTRKGSFGICANATEEDETVIISSEIIRLKLNNKYDSAYVSLFLNSNYGRSKFDRLATETMMLGINHGNLSEIEIPDIDTATQKQIDDKCRVWQAILRKSEAFVQAAKFDVEVLIEGKLDVEAIISGKLKAPTWEDIEKELEDI